MDFTRKTFPAQPYLYVDREVDYDGPKIAEAMGSAFGEVFGFIGQNAITPLAMPMSVYLVMDHSRLRFRGGVLVSAEDAARASGNVMADSLPAGDAMCATHVGPYANLNQTHQALWNHMKEQSIEAAMPVWEIYADDPQEVAEDKLRTDIFRAIA